MFIGVTFPEIKAREYQHLQCYDKLAEGVTDLD